MERLDKIVSAALSVSRKQAAEIIKKGKISVDGKTIKSTKEKLDEKNAKLFFDGKRIYYNKYAYIMMNKPKGVICASDGKGENTVIDLLPDEMKRRGLFPAGRLDRDTTGFVLVTDDGELAHSILSPKKHIPKTYIAELDKPIDEKIISSFESGVELKDDMCLPAQLEALDETGTRVMIIIRQGMYHQIKRMFAAFEITVMQLKRIKMGALQLDNSLKSGECRYITEDELQLLFFDK